MLKIAVNFNIEKFETELDRSVEKLKEQIRTKLQNHALDNQLVEARLQSFEVSFYCDYTETTFQHPRTITYLAEI